MTRKPFRTMRPRRARSGASAAPLINRFRAKLLLRRWLRSRRLSPIEKAWGIYRITGNVVPYIRERMKQYDRIAKKEGE